MTSVVTHPKFDCILHQKQIMFYVRSAPTDIPYARNISSGRLWDDSVGTEILVTLRCCYIIINTC